MKNKENKKNKKELISSKPKESASAVRSNSKESASAVHSNSKGAASAVHSNSKESASAGYSEEELKAFVNKLIELLENLDNIDYMKEKYPELYGFLERKFANASLDTEDGKITIVRRLKAALKSPLGMTFLVTLASFGPIVAKILAELAEERFPKAAAYAPRIAKGVRAARDAMKK